MKLGRQGLVKKKITVNRAGRPVQTSVWVRPEEHKAAQRKVAPAELAKLKAAQKNIKLEDNPDKYFDKPKGTKMVPLDKLDTTRVRPKGIVNAAKFMKLAAKGKKAKRGPITVFKKPNGRYEVLDGNSTTAIAKQSNWKELPVRVVSADEAAKIREGEAQKKAKKEESAARIAKREKVMTKWRRQAPGKGFEAKPTEQEAKDILEVGRFALISAGKNPNLEKDITPEQVAERHARLRERLVEEGFQFTQVEGKYGDEEDSFLVWVHDADREAANKIGTEFNQDSIIYGENGVYEMHYTTGPMKGQVEVVEEPPADESTTRWDGDTWDDVYTKIPLAGGGHYKFSINFQSWDPDHRDLAKPYKKGSRKEFLYGVDDKDSEVLSKLRQSKRKKK